jgi:hypothetical protein
MIRTFANTTFTFQCTLLLHLVTAMLAMLSACKYCFSALIKIYGSAQKYSSKQGLEIRESFH